MQIKMITIAAGPATGLLEPGKVYDVEEKQGQDLVGGGYATEVHAAKNLLPSSQLSGHPRDPALADVFGAEKQDPARREPSSKTRK